MSLFRDVTEKTLGWIMSLMSLTLFKILNSRKMEFYSG
jgi:hypothetical protein